MANPRPLFSLDFLNCADYPIILQPPLFADSHTLPTFPHLPLIPSRNQSHTALEPTFPAGKPTIVCLNDLAQEFDDTYALSPSRCITRQIQRVVLFNNSSSLLSNSFTVHSIILYVCRQSNKIWRWKGGSDLCLALRVRCDISDRLFRSVLQEQRHSSGWRKSCANGYPGLVPFLAYHHVLMVLILIAIILLCKLQNV